MSLPYNELIEDTSYENNIPLRPPSADSRKAYNSLSTQNNSNGPLRLITKLCYGVGGIPYQLCNTVIGLYLAPFLLEIAQIKPIQISIVLFAARGWDAITDPLIGFFVSKTNTRFGKMRPWIVFASPLSILTYIMIWYVPDISRQLKTVWYLLFYCLFQTFLSCLHVPYTSLTMYLTTDQKERDSATSFRMLSEIFGVLLAAIIQGIMITINGNLFPCDTSNATTTAQSYLSSNFTTTASPGYNKLGQGYLISAVVVGVIYFACTCTTFFGTKEIKDVIEDKDKQFIGALKAVFTHKSYLTLLVAFLCSSLCTQIIQANFALFCKYSIDAKDSYQILIIVLLVSSIVSLPVWNYIMVRFGKKTTYAAGLIILVPNLFVLLYFTSPIWVMYIITIISGFSIAVNFLLPWSMLPDVIDEFMVKTGTRRESIFYSFYVFFTKISVGLAVAVSSAFLELGGYIDCPNGCCTQPESVGQTLRYLVVPAPIILILISLIFIWIHPIDEKRRSEIRSQLIAIRKNNFT